MNGRTRRALALSAGLSVLASLLLAFHGTPRQPALPDLETALRLERHVAVLSRDIGERNWRKYAALAAARDYVAAELRSYGYEVEREEYRVFGKACHNLVASLPGRDPRLKREVIVVGGHYDSAPLTPGADDNASGVAVLLELARALAGHRPARTLRLVAFSTEEAYLFPGLTQPERLATMGSHHHAQGAKRRGEKIRGMLSLEMLGYYTDAPASQRRPAALAWLYPSRGDFALLVGDLSSAGLVWRLGRELRAAAGLPVETACLPRFVDGVQNSDHRNFWAAGYPAAMLTDTAFYRNGHYHRPTDTHDTLDYRRMSLLLPGLVQAIRQLAG